MAGNEVQQQQKEQVAEGAGRGTQEYANEVEVRFDVCNEELLAVLLQNFGGGRGKPMRARM